MKVTLKMMHPQLRAAGALMRIFPGSYSRTALKLLGRMTAKMGRKRARRLKDMRFEPVNITCGGRTLRLCIYRPLTQAKDTPGLLWIHGGGYALGFPEQDEVFIRRFISAVPCTVVAPDYRLSAEAPYPAALDDCYAALLWLRDHAEEYGIRSDHLMIGGDSAGGGLTAALAIRARDAGEVSVAYQMPLYPMLDDRMNTASSGSNAPVWTGRSNRSAWELYLGELFGREDVPCYAAPARLSDYSGLPPAFTFTGSIEPFRDETVHYMEALRGAGIPAEYRIFDGCYHAFDIMCPRSAPAREATALLLDNFRFAAENYHAPQSDKNSTKTAPKAADRDTLLG